MGTRRQGDMTQDKPIYTEESMQRQLSRFFAYSSVKYDIDGLYVFGWESDKLLETRSGYIYEFEIKVSRADFKNDFKHKRNKHIVLNSHVSGEKYLPEFYTFYEANKHRFASLEAWESHCRKIGSNVIIENHKRPNYFYYAVPPDLIAVDEVPQYAGLVYVKDYAFDIIKKAPLLHKVKYTDDQLGLGEKFYYNMVSWRQKCNTAKEERDMYRDKLDAEIKAKGQEGAYSDMKRECENMTSLFEESQRELSELRKLRYGEMRDHRRIERAMAAEIRKHDPGFNYVKFEEELLNNEQQ